MRLINTSTLVQEEFLGSHDLPAYAILSHCWGNAKDEVSFTQFQDKSYHQESYGWRKIIECCRLARNDGLQWAWVDTCCIDKSSSAELSEAINSMFQWYEQARVCYVFLPDVEIRDQSGSSIALVLSPAELRLFRGSRWFTRGWTLQELLAPALVVFFDQKFQRIGTKDSFATPISGATGIDKSYLRLKVSVKTASIACRMSWVSNRRTTRVEDISYCLIGIFDVNMPLLYGEGDRAFIRLQNVIMQTSQDSSIFAWGFPGGSDIGFTGVLASSPRAFHNSQDMVEDELHLHQSEGTFEMTSRGIEYWLKPLTFGSRNVFSIKLRCKVASTNEHVVIRTVRIGRTWYRIGYGLSNQRLTILDRLSGLFFAIVIPAHSIHLATDTNGIKLNSKPLSKLRPANRYTVVTVMLGALLSGFALIMWMRGGKEMQFGAISLLLFALEIMPLTARAILPLAWSIFGFGIWLVS